MTHLTLPYPPSLNRMYRMFNGRMLLSAEGRAYKDTVGWTARTARMVKHAGPIRLIVILHPKLRKKETDQPGRRIDLSNAIKLVEDALNGIAYDDDSQTISIRADVGEPIPGGGLSVEVCRVAPYVQNAQQGHQNAPQGAIVQQTVSAGG